ncbi:hypothetical protein K227x_17720 [Rubripirellula lacrimiformis]|uniref:Uncharacterized protein n=1 Tax=Rubripirellula lacrimiformis TaxID=1930273 RepID=A0A517N8D6_9BACT|nr:hypothetical protein K227x_17720 [Rubripirellula lacrimiformis]
MADLQKFIIELRTDIAFVARQPDDRNSGESHYGSWQNGVKAFASQRPDRRVRICGPAFVGPRGRGLVCR